MTLERDLRIETLGFLNRPRNVPKVPNDTNQQRRASVAGTNLYDVNNRIQETGFDHLLRIPRSNCVNIGTNVPPPAAAHDAISINVGASTSANWKMASNPNGPNGPNVANGSN